MTGPGVSSPTVWTKTADRPLRSWRKTLAIWAMARFLGVRVPWAAASQRDGAALLAHEHQRLLALAGAGEHVPAVVAFDGLSLSTADVGPTLDTVLRQLPDGPSQLALMLAAAADLAGFHARGQWHGGAQVRNLTWNGQVFSRFDFEETLHPAMALETVQVYDALQLLMSLSPWLEQLGPQAVEQVLQAYENTRPHTGLRPFCAALAPRLQRLLVWVDRTGWWSGARETRRLRVLMAGLQAFAAGA